MPAFSADVSTSALPQAAVASPSSWRDRLRWIPFAIWFLVIAGVMASLAISHWFSLPHPERRDDRLAAGLHELLHGTSDWAAVHVLYTDCQCSQRIIDHLESSKRPEKIHEVVLLVGDDPSIERRLAGKSYEIVRLTPDQLGARFGIIGAPLFVFVDPERTVRYIGGYTQRKQGPDIRDLAIMTEVQAGVAVADLPLFGCAIAQRLKELADPSATKR
ncbi:MAG: hypothetical protein R3B48_20675 [Kofleriaceae bacterium]